MMLSSPIDKSKVALRFAQARHSYDGHALAQQEICQNLYAFIEQYFIRNTLNHVLDIGCGSGQLSRLLLENFDINYLYLNDLYAEVSLNFTDLDRIQFCIGDIEEIVFDISFDMVVSSSALQWVNNLDHLFYKISQCLNAEGLLCFSTFGSNNLKEIKQLTGHGLNYLSLETIESYLVQNGFDVLHLSESIEVMKFRHPKDVLKHLKATGVTATSVHFKWTKTKLNEFYRSYECLRLLEDTEESLYPLTYHPIYCVARKKR